MASAPPPAGARPAPGPGPAPAPPVVRAAPPVVDASADPGPGRSAVGTPVAVEAVRAVTRLSRLLERRTGGLGLGQYRVLAAVAAGDQRASRVAERLALGKPSVSAAVDALCGRGLLARHGHAGDQRVVHLALTPAGRALLDEVEAAMGAALTRVAEGVPDPQAALSLLAALGRALDDSSPASGDTA